MCKYFGKYFAFFKERSAAAKRYQEKCVTASEHIFLRKNMQLRFLELCPLKLFEVIKINIMMETSPQKPITFTHFKLNYVDKGNIGRIPIAVKNIGRLFRMATEVIEANTLHLFFLSDGTR